MQSTLYYIYYALKGTNEVEGVFPISKEKQDIQNI